MRVETNPEKSAIRRNALEWAQSFWNASFRCPAKCNACCRRTVGPALTVRDFQRLSRQEPHSNFAEERGHPLFPYLLKTREGSCLFLDEQGRCGIYAIRPILCRVYPLQLHIQWDGKLMWCLEHCPGVNVEGGTALESSYLQNVLNEIWETEGPDFLATLREYVLKTKRPLTLLFKTPSGGVYSDWDTKRNMKEIVWGMSQAKPLEGLTLRGRLECVLHELLAPLEVILVMKSGRHSPDQKFIVDHATLAQACEEYQGIFHGLASESAARERCHLERLKKEGNIAYGPGASARGARQSPVLVGGFDGRKIQIDAARLMRGLPLHPEACRVEEGYLNELQRREGRFGSISTDLAVRSEVALMFLAADGLELKANAFAIEKGKEIVGVEEMKEAVWIFERHLSALLDRVEEGEKNNLF